MMAGTQIATFFSFVSAISLSGVRLVFGIASVALVFSLALHRFAQWLLPTCPPPLSQVLCGVVLAFLAHWMLGRVPVSQSRAAIVNGEVLRRLLLGQRLEAVPRVAEVVPATTMQDKRRHLHALQERPSSAISLILAAALVAVGLLVALRTMLQMDTGSTVVLPGSDSETLLLPAEAIAPQATLDGNEPYQILQSQIVELQAELSESRSAWQREVANLKREVYRMSQRVEQVAAERAIAEASIAA
eukprot:CAMPEP_0172715154 /NCGR_PEP_ID=MMETSP1074-20121228/67380_1 /TAXON_ID=2916 /ORGANISM="Ceratium fusus, Strain PA161109" /LENGTH=244 /DNA_ID=CAMNT_0013539701 /DNA_START=60 /DNA_END=791 /DNA_ORIENTATION=-